MSFFRLQMLLVAVFFVIIQYSRSGFVNSQNASSATEETCDCKKLLIGRFQSQNLSVDCVWMLLGCTFISKAASQKFYKHIISLYFSKLK